LQNRNGLFHVIAKHFFEATGMATVAFLAWSPSVRMRRTRPRKNAKARQWRALVLQCSDAEVRMAGAYRCACNPHLTAAGKSQRLSS
jgi:hypothetical protein